MESKTASLRLTINVHYNLGSEEVKTLKGVLESFVVHGASACLFSGETDAWVNGYDYEITDITKYQRESITIMGNVWKTENLSDFNWFLKKLTWEQFLEIERVSAVTKENNLRNASVPESGDDVSFFSELPTAIENADIFSNMYDDHESAEIIYPSTGGNDALPLGSIEMVVGHDGVFWRVTPENNNNECETDSISIQKLREAFHKE